MRRQILRITLLLLLGLTSQFKGMLGMCELLLKQSVSIGIITVLRSGKLSAIQEETQFHQQGLRSMVSTIKFLTEGTGGFYDHYILVLDTDEVSYQHLL